MKRIIPIINLFKENNIMAVTQTITITDNSGKSYQTVDEVMSQLNTDVPMTDAISTLVESSTSDGSLSEELNMNRQLAPTGVIITRVWDDDKWAEFSALDGVSSSTFTEAGWSVDSSDDS
jgi:hypothetical protein